MDLRIPETSSPLESLNSVHLRSLDTETLGLSEVVINTRRGPFSVTEPLPSKDVGSCQGSLADTVLTSYRQ